MNVSSSTDRLPKVSGVAAVSLAAMQVDVTTHLGAVGPATSTGFPGLDQLLGGGLRSGMVMALSGAAGSGRTSVALALAYLALIGSVLGFLLYFWLVTKIEVTKTMLISLVTPVTALLIGWVRLGEKLSWRVAAGSAAAG